MSLAKLNKVTGSYGERITYCSVLDPQPKLVCFLEVVASNVSRGGQLKTSVYNLSTDSNPIVHIEALPTFSDENGATSFDIFSFHGDGEICCYDKTLTSKNWNARLPQGRDSNQRIEKLHVEHVSTISIKQAAKTVLRNREDIVNILDARHGVYASNLSVLLTRSRPDTLADHQGTLQFRILAFRNTHGSGSEAHFGKRDPIEELVSLTIPEPTEVKGKDASFRLHTSSGLLYQETTGDLSIYDLTLVTPRLVQTMNFSWAKAGLSYLRISSELIATSSKDSIFLVDTTFSSFQGRYALPMPKQGRSKFPNDGKAKPPTSEAAVVQLLSYHCPSGSAVILFGRSLMAVDLSIVTAQKTLSRKRKRNGLLIDAIGRGSLSTDGSHRSRSHTENVPKVLGQILNPYEETSEWGDQMEIMNAVLEKGDLHEFDQKMASALEDRKIVAGHAYPPESRVDYLLSTMFSTNGSGRTELRDDGSSKSKLHLRRLPERAWQCLMQQGLMSTDRLEASLKRQSLMLQNDVLPDNDLIQTVADHDPTLTALSSLLQSPCLLKISEVCHTLKILTARFATLAAPHSTKLLTQRKGLLDREKDGVDHAGVEDDIPNGGSLQRMESRDRFNTLLDTVIQRCNTCPTSLLTKALKKQFLVSELRNVVDLLRIKLAQDGWLSLYTENEPTAEEDMQYHNNHISMIARLLSCIVDSLGTGGWLLNSNIAEGSAEAAETISYMKAEICAALEGVEQAAYLQGILGEALFCGKGALHSQADRPPPVVDIGDRQKCALPLGLKLDNSISLTKIGAGGEIQKRSRRDIGKLKSRQVPEYSFERIAV
ncbi:MAG: hypothetical protein Q9170_003195 [Blastenia crenularia]